MNLNEVYEKCSGLKVCESREMTDEYIEVVFYTKDSDEWVKALSETIDPPRKPAGEKPSKEIITLTKPFGGVWDNQTFFIKEYPGFAVVAMFWPWGNGEQTTLKLFIAKEK